MDDREKTRTGRQALFKGTEKRGPESDKIPVSEISEMIDRIRVYQGDDPVPQVPELWAPVIGHIVDIARKIRSEEEAKNELGSQLRISQEEVGRIKKELEQISQEHETYLSDLISSHTEFDRALEIFQYHEIPMVLVDDTQAIHDANDAFCTLYSINRSELTSAFPPLDRYFDPGASSCITPDTGRYDIVHISPPIIPFNHESSSLLLLIRNDRVIPEKDESQGESKTRNDQTTDLLHKAFDLFPIPAAIVNQVNSITVENAAFLHLTQRVRDQVHLRDLGSSGLAPDIAARIREDLLSGKDFEFQSSIFHPSGEEVPVYIRIIPLASSDPDEPSSLIICAENPPETGSESDGREESGETGEPVDSLKTGSSLIDILIDLNTASIAILDQDKRIIRTNESFSELSGVSSEELIGASVVEMGLVRLAGSSENPDKLLISENVTINSQWGTQVFSSLLFPLSGTDPYGKYVLALQSSEPALPAPAIPIPSEEIPGRSPGSRLIESLMDLNPSALALLDHDKKIIRTNEGFSELSGVSSEELIGASVVEMGLLKLADPSVNPDKFLISENISINSQWGTQVFSTLLFPLSDDNSEGGFLLLLQPSESVAGAPASGEIISPESVNSRLIESLIDLNPSALAYLDQNKKIVRANEGFSELSGVSSEELIGASVEEMDLVRLANSSVNPDKLLISENISVNSQWGTQVFSTLLFPLSDDGKEGGFLLLLQSSEPAGVPGAPVSGESTTPETTSPLIESLIDLNPSALAILDKDKKIIRANEGFSELSGVSSEELVGTPVEEMGLIKHVSSPADESSLLISDDISVNSEWGTQKFSTLLFPVSDPRSEAGFLIVLQSSEPDQNLPGNPEPAQVSSSDVKYKDLLTISPVPALLSDTNGSIILANEPFYQLSGFVTGSLVHRNIGDALPSMADCDEIGQGRAIQVSFPSGKKILTRYNRKISESSGDIFDVSYFCDISPYVSQNLEGHATIEKLRDDIRSLQKQLEESGAEIARSELSTENIDIVVFELNTERYAIDISMVREVVDMVQITPLPKTPPYVVGIINLRGEVTHIIDLGILLGERSVKERSEQKIIIVPQDTTHGEHIGIIVDNVQSVTEIMGRQVNSLGDDINSHIRTHIKGIIKISKDDTIDKRTNGQHGAELVIWLDVQKILSELQGS